jgi:hypothetical protein
MLVRLLLENNFSEGICFLIHDNLNIFPDSDSECHIYFISNVYIPSR